MGTFLDFQRIKQDVSFSDAIELLDLRMKFAANQWRSTCPTCGGDDRSLVITQAKGFYCHRANAGGDVIGLAKHVLDLASMRDAAFELADRAGITTGTSNSKSTVRQGTSRTVPESERELPSRARGGAPKAPPQPTRQPFDPDEFWAKTTYTEEVAELGIDEDQAEELRIGFYRGKLYQALRYADGKVAGYSSFANGELKLPSNLLPSNVVPFAKRA